jgi:DUF4097 and DUF4098 domain-containing protein YvlB
MAETSPGSMQPHFLRRLAGATGAALLALSLGACDLAMSGFREEAKDIWSKSYPLAANGRLEIVNTSGGIYVTPTDGSQVEIKAERIARAATQQGANDLLQKLEMREDVSSGRVHLESRQPSMTGFHGSVEVRYIIRVPRSASVDLRETNGHVEVTGLSHETHLSTTNGHINGTKLDGTVHASTTNGRIALEMTSVTQDIEAETTNGSVTVRVPTDANADVSARVTNGHIGIEGLPSLKAEDENSRRRFSGRLNNGGHAIRLQTTNGSITLTSAAIKADDEGDKGKVEKEKKVLERLER